MPHVAPNLTLRQHIHPIINAERGGGLGGTDNEISHISNVLNNTLYKDVFARKEFSISGNRQSAVSLWHSYVLQAP